MKELTDSQIERIKLHFYNYSIYLLGLSHDDGVELVSHAVAGIVNKAADEVTATVQEPTQEEIKKEFDEVLSGLRPIKIKADEKRICPRCGSHHIWYQVSATVSKHGYYECMDCRLAFYCEHRGLL